LLGVLAPIAWFGVPPGINIEMRHAGHGSGVPGLIVGSKLGSLLSAGRRALFCLAKVRLHNR
jgi:hypothetical protein